MIRSNAKSSAWYNYNKESAILAQCNEFHLIAHHITIILPSRKSDISVEIITLSELWKVKSLTNELSNTIVILYRYMKNHKEVWIYATKTSLSDQIPAYRSNKELHKWSSFLNENKFYFKYSIFNVKEKTIKKQSYSAYCTSLKFLRYFCFTSKRVYVL